MDMSGDREGLAALLMRVRSEDFVAGRLMEAVEAIPRRLFVPDGVADPYGEHTFPLPCGQTMPSARTAVRIAAALRVQPEHRVLEIGTGSGYVTALLARLGVHVVTLERYRTLSSAASERLRTCSLSNVTFLQEDGRAGYAEAAPYDRIVVHGSFDELPKAFVDQMASGAMLVAAIGAGGGVQQMVRHHRQGSRFELTPLFPVRLQPLEIGKASLL
jgi:protein-L-isoaspartate(D-aspartate) O-methyltransferase